MYYEFLSFFLVYNNHSTISFIVVFICGLVDRFRKGLDIPLEAKEELSKLTPMSYIGDAIKLARDI